MNSTHHFSTINEFIDAQARRVPGLPAIGFPQPYPEEANQEWDEIVLSYLDLRQLSILAALNLQYQHGDQDFKNRSQCVGLLCPSSTESLLAWLGLMRLGHLVLLISPRCKASAISYLCKTCDISFLVYHWKYESLADESVEVSLADNDIFLNAVVLPESFSFAEESTFSKTSKNEISSHPKSPNDVAYFYHGSGASTGLPTLVPQTHRAAVGVLPSFPGSTCSSFSTIPLYDGGIADCFRAWTSDSMIWLFPGKEISLNSANICKALECVNNATESGISPQLKYFSTGPDVLQMLAMDERSLSRLQNMEIVSVDGPALPTKTGDGLVEKGVNLVLRFSNAECGFLLSSHRNFSFDKEWQFLRSECDYLAFEKRESGLSELIILPGWPNPPKRNRPDRSYATSGLFEPHHKIPNAWRYHSHSASQISSSLSYNDSSVEYVEGQ